MKQELQNRLFEKYPNIFKQKDLPATDTCMCWGITCGDGWYNILDTLCSQIKHQLEYNIGNDEGSIIVEATQVKEKYGGLRFYYSGGDEFIRGLASMAEGLSSCTCENCGSPGTQNDKGWVSTMCTACRKNITEIREKRIKEAHRRIYEDHKDALQKLADGRE